MIRPVPGGKCPDKTNKSKKGKEVKGEKGGKRMVRVDGIIQITYKNL